MSTGPADWLLPDDAARDDAGRLQIGGCDVVDLATTAGTPAYVYSERDLRSRARSFREAGERASPGARVLLSIKALPCRAAVALAAEEGLGWEAGSSPEVRLALAAGADPALGVFTGTDKGEESIRIAVEAGVGLVTVDAEDEVERLSAVAGAVGRRQDVLLRLTPRIAVEGIRHDPATGQLDRKAGLELANGAALRAAEQVQRSESLSLAGVHFHLGARLQDAVPETIEQSVRFVADHDLPCELIDVGGGPVATTSGPPVPTIAEHVTRRAAQVEEAMSRAGRPRPRLLFEPGQAVVGPAGVTVYRVVGVHRGVRTYVIVDGGLYENPRPLLYGTAYRALPAIATAGETQALSIAGITAENGDVLAWDVDMPCPRSGDVLVIPATGAYTYSMASNWGRFPRPPVIFCCDGRARTVVRRETFEEVLARDLG